MKKVMRLQANKEKRDRARGALVGLAVGDAVGTTNEFKVRGHFEEIVDMVGGGPFKLKAGEWTDDTSMALCLAESLILKQGFDPQDVMQRWIDWSDNGKFSVKGYCFDIGTTTADSLHHFKMTGEIKENNGEFTQANGSIMRLAPAAIAAKTLEDASRLGRMQSKLTHAHQTCLTASSQLGRCLYKAINGEDFPTNELRDYGLGDDPDWHYWLAETNEADIESSGYVVDTLRAALWGFFSTDSFEEGALKVANLGDDSDTVGAVFGQIAGAHYGMSGIPTKWLDKLVDCQMMIEMADQLLDLELVADIC